MSLLDDLKGLNIDAVLNARANISVSVNDADLLAVVDSGALTQVMGSLGTAIDAIVKGVENPEALFEPLMQAFLSVFDEIKPDDFPLDEYREAIEQGARIIVELAQNLGGNNAADIRFPGGKLGDLMSQAVGTATRYAEVQLGDVGQLKSVMESLENGAPANPAALARLALENLLPYDFNALKHAREGVDGIINGVGAVQLDASAINALLAAFDAVAAAAATKNRARLDAAMADLERIRHNTLVEVERAMGAFNRSIDDIDIGRYLGVIKQGADLIKSGERGVLGFLQQMQHSLAQGRVMIESAEPGNLLDALNELFNWLETFLRDNIEKPIDQQVENFKNWLRSLLNQIPLREYRAKLTALILGIAKTIQDANLGQYADQARAFLNDIENVIDNFDLAQDIQDALQGVNDLLDGFLGNIGAELNNIVSAIQSVADQAAALMTTAAEHLEKFQTTINELTELLNSLDVEQAAEQVVAKLAELRRTAEQLLSVAPLPDSLRPVVEQMISELDSLGDEGLQKVFEPVEQAAAEFEIPDEVLDTINEVIAEAAKLIENLITPELIASIDAEIRKVTDEIRKLDPAALLGDLDKYVTDAADFVAGLDPRPVVADIRGPYDKLLELFDAAHPNRLLSPVFDAYDSLLGGIELPDTDSAISSMTDVVSSAGRSVSDAMTTPLRSVMPEGSVEAIEDPENPPEEITQQAPDLGEFNAGDVVRMLGWVPNKLREGLQALDESAAGDAVREIDKYCGALARDLRRVQAELWAAEERLIAQLDAMVLPLRAAQFKAQLAIRVNFQSDIADVELNGMMLAVAKAGPGEFRRSIATATDDTRERLRAVVRGSGGSMGALLERTASALEECALGQIGDSLESLLDALDLEPIATEMDELVAAVLVKLPELLEVFDDSAEIALNRIRNLLQIYNPMALAEKFLSVGDVLKEEIALLDPRRLAAELGEIHGAIRSTITAYDPGVFAQEIYDIIEAVSDKLRSLTVENLLPDLTFLDTLIANIETMSPAQILSTLDTGLDAVADRLQALDLEGLVDALNELPEEVVRAFKIAAEGIITEIRKLLEAIKYVSAEGSASVSVSASASTG